MCRTDPPSLDPAAPQMPVSSYCLCLPRLLTSQRPSAGAALAGLHDTHPAPALSHLHRSLHALLRPGSDCWAPWNRLGVAPLTDLLVMYGTVAAYFSREFAAGPAALGPEFQVSRQSVGAAHSQQSKAAQLWGSPLAMLRAWVPHQGAPKLQTTAARATSC